MNAKMLNRHACLNSNNNYVFSLSTGLVTFAFKGLVVLCGIETSILDYIVFTGPYLDWLQWWNPRKAESEIHICLVNIKLNHLKKLEKTAQAWW